jgi:hypothetical protein
LRIRRRRRDHRLARPSRLELLLAQRKGKADGRDAITGPAPGWEQRQADLEEAWTPFIAQVRDEARAVSNQLATALIDDHRALISKLYRQAEVVIRQHDFDHELTAATRGRFIGSLTHCRMAVAPARARAEAAVDYANQLIHCYWGAYLLGYRQADPAAVLPVGWRPGAAVIDPYWAKPDPFLLLTFGLDGEIDDEATTRAAGTLRRAMEIIANCRCPICKRANPGDDGR